MSCHGFLFIDLYKILKVIRYCQDISFDTVLICGTILQTSRVSLGPLCKIFIYFYSDQRRHCVVKSDIEAKTRNNFTLSF